jgi:hypothetical protein
MAFYKAMTIFYTSQSKKGIKRGLWITGLVFFFGLCILKPALATTINYGYEDCTAGQSLSSCGWSGPGAASNAVSSPVHSGSVAGLNSWYQYKSMGYGSSNDIYISYWFYGTPTGGDGLQWQLSDNINNINHGVHLSPKTGGTQMAVCCGSYENCSLVGANFSTSTWNHIEFSSVDTSAHTYMNGVLVDTRTCTNTFGDVVLAAPNGGSWYVDDITIAESAPPTASYLTIDSPTSGSTASSTFSLDFTYNFFGEGWDKMYVVFEAWNASSTCPLYGTDEWQTEYNEGWFYNQSLPYFSPILTATSTEATSSIQVYNLEEPYLYNCNYCYFYNYEEATSTLINKCPDYILNVSGYVPPSQPVPIGSWQSYYASHTSDKFPTSTDIFTSISGTFSGIVEKLTSFVNDFRSIFDAENASAKGTELGQKIPLARGYLKPINDFFGGIPVSDLFMLVLLVLLVVILYRIIARILHLIRG